MSTLKNVFMFLCEFIVLNIKVWFYVSQAIWRKICPPAPRDISGQVILITGWLAIKLNSIETLQVKTYILFFIVCKFSSQEVGVE